MRDQNLSSLRLDELEGLVNQVRQRYDSRTHMDYGTAASGNWGHAGRPGLVGGSRPGGGAHNRISTPGGGYTSKAKQAKAAKQQAKQQGKTTTKTTKKTQPKKSKAEQYMDNRKAIREKMKAVDAAKKNKINAEDAYWDAKYMKGDKKLIEETKQKLDEATKALNDLNAEIDADCEKYGVKGVLEKAFFKSNIEYNPVAKRDTPLSEDEIIKKVSGGDRTSGSCASVALAYVGQKQGYDVLDFRGGGSQFNFSRKANLVQVFKDSGVEPIVVDSAKTSVTNGKNALKKLKEGKQYYFFTGEHAAIVRLVNGKPQYLELQSNYDSGWKKFNGNVGYTLTNRFGCKSKSKDDNVREAYLIDIDQIKGEVFENLLGYLNTNEQSQEKGSDGYAK